MSDDLMPYEDAVAIVYAVAGAVMDCKPRPPIPKGFMPREAIAEGVYRFNREFCTRVDIEVASMSDDIAVQEHFRRAFDLLIADVSRTINEIFKGKTQP
jgi:hypothetical protein